MATSTTVKWTGSSSRSSINLDLPPASPCRTPNSSVSDASYSDLEPWDPNLTLEERIAGEKERLNQMVEDQKKSLQAAQAYRESSEGKRKLENFMGESFWQIKDGDRIVWPVPDDKGEIPSVEEALKAAQERFLARNELLKQEMASCLNPDEGLDTNARSPNKRGVKRATMHNSPSTEERSRGRSRLLPETTTKEQPITTKGDLSDLKNKERNGDAAERPLKRKRVQEDDQTIIPCSSNPLANQAHRGRGRPRKSNGEDKDSNNTGKSLKRQRVTEDNDKPMSSTGHLPTTQPNESRKRPRKNTVEVESRDYSERQLKRKRIQDDAGTTTTRTQHPPIAQSHKSKGRPRKSQGNLQKPSKVAKEAVHDKKDGQSRDDTPKKKRGRPRKGADSAGKSNTLSKKPLGRMAKSPALSTHAMRTRNRKS